MAKIPKESVKKLTLFQQEVSKLFKDMFESEEAEEEQKIFDNVNFPILVDVFETEESFIVEAEIPGIEKNKITLEIADDSLIIKGIKRDMRDKHSKLYYYCMERDFGKFNRVVELPKACDSAKAVARVEDGLLLVEFPKIKERRGKSKKIDIEGNGDNK